MSKITAHSGCDGMPDNSMEFVRYALGSEGDCFEVDIRRNRNEELILSHDESTEMAVKLSQVFELLKERPDKLKGLSQSNWCDPKEPVYSIGLIVYIVLIIAFAYFYIRWE